MKVREFMFIPFVHLLQRSLKQLCSAFGTGVANFGYASAMSFLVFIMVAILAVINLKVGDSRD